MNSKATNIILSASASTGVAIGVDASPLLTALITLGVSIVTTIGSELVKYAVAYFKAKTKQLEEVSKNKEGEEDGKVH